MEKNDKGQRSCKLVRSASQVGRHTHTRCSRGINLRKRLHLPNSLDPDTVRSVEVVVVLIVHPGGLQEVHYV